MIAEKSRELCFFYLFFQILLKQETSNYTPVPWCLWTKQAKIPAAGANTPVTNLTALFWEAGPRSRWLGRLGRHCWQDRGAGQQEDPDLQQLSSPLCLLWHWLGRGLQCWSGEKGGYAAWTWSCRWSLDRFCFSTPCPSRSELPATLKMLSWASRRKHKRVVLTHCVSAS